MDLRYEIGKHYYFKISSINESFDTRGREAITILVECDPGIKIRVRGHKWQKKEFWNFDNLKCEVKSIDNQGIPFLVNTDFRHPNYQEGEIYNFKVIDSIVKKNKDVDGTSRSYKFS